MTVITLQSPPRAWILRTDLMATLLIGWHAMRQHRRMRRELVALSRKPPRILRDMGLDPERVYEALDGTWDEVGRAHLSRLLRKEAAPSSRRFGFACGNGHGDAQSGYD